MSNPRKKSTDQAQKQRAADYQLRQKVHANLAKRRNRDNLLSLTAGLLVLVLFVALPFIFQNTEEIDTDPTAGPTAAPTLDPNAPSKDLSENRTWSGELQLNEVTLQIELDGVAAPQAVASFVHLVNEDFFNEIGCHRLTATPATKLIQCGDPNGDGTGGPGYSFGPIENSPANSVYPAGTIAMARLGHDSYSMGSQFFITLSDTTIQSNAVGGYTVFGRVVSGLDELISEITDKGVQGGGTDGAPVIETVITSVAVS